jgi:hypothetical protein
MVREHLARIHSINVVRAEHEHVRRLFVTHQIHVLE